MNDIQDVRPIIRHVTAHPHGVAAAYDELLKSAPGGARAKLPIRGARGGGVFSQFVVNPAPQVLPSGLCSTADYLTFGRLLRKKKMHSRRRRLKSPSPSD